MGSWRHQNHHKDSHTAALKNFVEDTSDRRTHKRLAGGEEESRLRRTLRREAMLERDRWRMRRQRGLQLGTTAAPSWLID